MKLQSVKSNSTDNVNIVILCIVPRCNPELRSVSIIWCLSFHPCKKKIGIKLIHLLVGQDKCYHVPIESLICLVLSRLYRLETNIVVPVSLAQLVGTLYNLCRGQGSNPGHSTSPHLIVWASATRLLDKKKLI
jgi:hypothetical protein